MAALLAATQPIETLSANPRIFSKQPLAPLVAPDSPTSVSSADTETSLELHEVDLESVSERVVVKMTEVEEPDRVGSIQFADVDIDFEGTSEEESHTKEKPYRYYLKAFSKWVSFQIRTFEWSRIRDSYHPVDWLKQASPVEILKLLVLFTLVGGCLTIFIAFLIRDSFAQKGVTAFLTWTRHLNFILGALSLAGVYGLSLSMLLPMTPFNLAAGYIFKVWKGVPVALLGYYIGQTLSYWLANTLFKSYIETKMREKEKQYRLLRAIRLALRENGMKLVILSHLSPIFPAGMLNYFYALSPISFFVYTIGSLVGVIPSIIFMNLVGSEIQNLNAMWAGAEESSSTTSTLLYGLGAVAVTAVVIMAFGYFAKKELEKLHSSHSDEEDGSSSTEAGAEGADDDDDGVMIDNVPEPENAAESDGNQEEYLGDDIILDDQDDDNSRA